MKKLMILALLLSFFGFANRVFGQNNPQPVDQAAKNLVVQKSVDSLTLVIQAETDSTTLANLYFKRAKWEATLSRLISAIDDYTKTIALNPKIKQAYVGRGTLYEHTHNFQAAIDDYERAITFYKDDTLPLAFLYGRIGLLQWGLKRYPEAMQADSISNQLNPNDGFARINMGLVHFATEDYELAIRDITIGLSNFKGDKVALSIAVTNRADAERHLKKYKDAINDYSVALEMYPENSQAHWNKALTYRLNGDYEFAEAEYSQTVIYLKGDNESISRLYDERSQMEIEAKKYNEALRDDSLSISFNNKYPWPYLHRAIAYTGNGDCQLAIEACLLALNYYKDEKDNSSSIYSTIAHNTYFLGHYDKTIEASTTAIGLDSSSRNPYFSRGRAYLKKKQKDLAMADFNKVLAMDTSKRSYEYAFALFYTGNPENAVKLIQENIAATTSRHLLQTNYYSLACLYSLMNKPDEANIYLKKCIDNGFPKKYAQVDPDLDNIKHTIGFKDMIEPKLKYPHVKNGN